MYCGMARRLPSNMGKLWSKPAWQGRFECGVSAAWVEDGVPGTKPKLGLGSGTGGA